MLLHLMICSMCAPCALDDVYNEVMETIRDAYRRESCTFRWQAGDVLLLDNMLVAHSRRRYEGPREVTVAMAVPTGRGTTAP